MRKHRGESWRGYAAQFVLREIPGVMLEDDDHRWIMGKENSSEHTYPASAERVVRAGCTGCTGQNDLQSPILPSLGGEGGDGVAGLGKKYGYMRGKCGKCGENAMENAFFL